VETDLSVAGLNGMIAVTSIDSGRKEMVSGKKYRFALWMLELMSVN